MPKSTHGIAWESLARFFIDWKRIAILEILAMDEGRVLSVKEMGEELQISTSVASYHVDELKKAGLLGLVKEEPRRGAIEHYYRLSGAA